MRILGLTIGMCVLLAWAAATAAAQETSPPKATVSIGAQAVAAEGYGGGCTFYFTEDGGPLSGACPISAWPPTRFSNVTATGEPAIIRFDRPMTLHPYTGLWNRDPVQRTFTALNPVQRDEVTWEVVLPSIDEPKFLTFGGPWSTGRARGDAGYVVGVLPLPQVSALEIRKVKWRDARLRVSGKVHPYATFVALRFACNGSAIARTVPVAAGKWSIDWRTPSVCATTSDGRLVARVSGTERLRPGKVALRIAHRVVRR